MSSKGSMSSKGWDFRLPMLVFSPIIKVKRLAFGAGFPTGVYKSL
jgi:hypothetical protein